MGSHRCEYCGNVFDPVKHGVCPNCGAAVSAAVMAKIEREQAASRARVERMKEDVVRRHEQATRTGQYGMPERLSNASQSPFRTGRPARPGKTVKNPTAFSLVVIVVCVVLMMLAMNRVRALRDSRPVVNDDPDRPWEENSETVGRVFYEVPENAATLELHVEGLMTVTVVLTK